MCPESRFFEEAVTIHVDDMAVLATETLSSADEEDGGSLLKLVRYCPSYHLKTL